MIALSDLEANRLRRQLVMLIEQIGEHFRQVLWIRSRAEMLMLTPTWRSARCQRVRSAKAWAITQRVIALVTSLLGKRNEAVRCASPLRDAASGPTLDLVVRPIASPLLAEN
jgi:hypothetical protein